MSKSKIRLLIFDFDGTLARSKQLYVQAIYKTLNEYGYRTTRKEIEKLLGKRVEEVLSILNIKKDIIKIKKEINNYVLKKANNLKPCPFVKEINKLEFYKVVVSNSLVAYMKPLLKKQKLEFDKLIGPEMKSKLQIFRYIFSKYKVKSHEVIYIGDRAEDVEIARLAKCKSIIISNKCSWSSLAEILKEKPDAVVKSLKGLRNAIKDL